MSKRPYRNVLRLATVSCFVILPAVALAQSAAHKKIQAEVGEKALVDRLEETQRRSFAISLVTSLADEARSYRDQSLRPHVLARAADTLWNTDADTARKLFGWAWEAAEKADAEESTVKSPGDVSAKAAAMITALRRSRGSDLRADVLALAARRDPALGEEFLNKLKDETNTQAANFKSDAGPRTSSDSWASPEAVSKRLQLAAKLLDQGEVELGLKFAMPALERVSANTIKFLSTLRGKKPEVADKMFALLLARAEFDPASDANTVSGLSFICFYSGSIYNILCRWRCALESTGRSNLFSEFARFAWSSPKPIFSGRCRHSTAATSATGPGLHHVWAGGEVHDS